MPTNHVHWCIRGRCSVSRAGVGLPPPSARPHCPPFDESRAAHAVELGVSKRAMEYRFGEDACVRGSPIAMDVCIKIGAKR